VRTHPLLFCAVILDCKTDICQDRLETNEGKVEKKETLLQGDV
jgi:hypothetical protein